MGSSDRDYFKDEARRWGNGSRPPMPPVTKWLLGINVVVFVLNAILTSQGERAGPLEDIGAFSIAGLLSGRIWTPLTFQFLHAGPGHLLFNCLAMWLFGPIAENWWGGRRFLRFYLLCGVAGSLFYSLLAVIGVIPSVTLATRLVGASAGIFGMLVTACMVAPEAPVKIVFPPVTTTMRKLAYVLLGIAGLTVLGDLVLNWREFSNSGGEAGHLGGALLGWVLMRNPRWLGKKDGDDRKILRPEAFKKSKRSQEPKLRPRSELTRAETTAVDRILDKINRDGFDSLTADERDVLNRASGPNKR